MYRTFVLLLLTLFLSPASTVRAQDELPSASSVRQAYEGLDFDRAMTLAERVIASAEDYAGEDLVEVHTIAALVLMSRNEVSRARSHFASALSINPDLTLDPLLASPKVVEVFQEVKRATSASNVSSADPSVRYVRVFDPRPAAAVRSMLVPGWGQMYKGQQRRGLVLMSVWGATTAGTIAAHVIRNSREDSYLSETEAGRIQDRFDSFNRWHKIRNSIALAALTTWIVSYVDALLYDYPSPGVATLQTGRLEFSPEGPGGISGPTIRLRISMN